MLRHLLKLIWKRKTRNLMLSLEILLAFVIVFAIAAIGVRNVQLYQLPTGFGYRDVWSVGLVMGQRLLPGPTAAGAAAPDELAPVYAQLKRVLEGMPEVERVAFASNSPYSHSTMSNEFQLPGGERRVATNMLDVSDDFFAVTGMTLLQGRWFSTQDDGVAATPVVINRALAATLFPGQSALGKVFSDSEREDAVQHMLKVTGVIEDYRHKGELMTPVNFMFQRAPPERPDGLRTILLKVKPGTERAFEAKLNAQLKLIRNDWSYEIAPLPAMRASLLREDLIPLMVLAVVGAFMLVMVGFGLFGVLWQNTTGRIPEIGLRRALGATAGDVYGQIVAEQMLLSTAAMLVALALLVQLPLTGALGAGLNWQVFLIATGVSMMVIYLISLLCAMYPGWRASRLSPTEALHYE
jgi:putative ABC transport system permease protein